MNKPDHNQKLVYDAIKRGYAEVEDIASRTKLDATKVRNAIKRLQDLGEIRRREMGGYYAVGKRCLLEEAWPRKVRA